MPSGAKRSRAAALAAVFAAMCVFVVGCQGKPAVPPSIEFSIVPPASDGGPDMLEPIAGRVTGARPGQRIVLFSKGGIWWVQPFTGQPFTTIAGDSTWKSKIHLGTEYAALLVEPGYKPADTVASLPAPGGGVIAVATVKGSGTYTPVVRRTLAFSGYDWEIRQTPSDRGGPNSYDARNAWTDAGGALHLTLSQRNDRWTSAEVRLTRSLGYGTYVFVVRDTSHLDPAAVLGMLTWDDFAVDQNHRELDVEIGRWGDSANKDAQYVVQPHYVAANVFRFLTQAGRLTHSFRWEPGRAAFKTVRGGSVEGKAIVAMREFTSGVPVPGAEVVCMNLLYFRSSPAPPARDVEVVIEKFQYLP
jgi:hypothetical protein